MMCSVAIRQAPWAVRTPGEGGERGSGSAEVSRGGLKAALQIPAGRPPEPEAMSSPVTPPSSEAWHFVTLASR